MAGRRDGQQFSLDSGFRVSFRPQFVIDPSCGEDSAGASGDRRELVTEAVLYALRLLVVVNIHEYSNDRQLPSIYARDAESRPVVEYSHDEDLKHEWRDANTLFRLGVGNCKDLVAAAVAYYKVRCGLVAFPVVTHHPRSTNTEYHVQLMRNSQLPLPPGASDSRVLRPARKPGFWLEDPSAALGMNGVIY